jgi:hypothetical protein
MVASKWFWLNPHFLFKGILKLSESDFQQKLFFDSSKSDFKLMKFVPASGAATRMFKFLRNFLDEYDVLNESINILIEKKAMSLLFSLLEWTSCIFETIDAKVKEEFSDFDSLDRNYKTTIS